MAQHRVWEQHHSSQNDHKDPCDGREEDVTADTSAPNSVQTFIPWTNQRVSGLSLHSTSHITGHLRHVHKGNCLQACIGSRKKRK